MNVTQRDLTQLEQSSANGVQRVPAGPIAAQETIEAEAEPTGPIVTITLTVKPPRKDAPGYLRRQKEFTEIARRLTEEGAVDELLNWYIKYCEIQYAGALPAGKTEQQAIRDALLDLSEDDFLNLLKTNETSSLPPTNSGP